MSEAVNVLVTGGAGFIGSHLVSRLLSDGHSVTVLDDFSTGKRSNLPPAGPRLTIREGDVADQSVLQAALEGQDAFVHLAAVASVQASTEDPVKTHRTNLEGSIRLFDTAARLGVRKGVYASSAAVYGDNPQLPLTEDAELRPLTPYAVDKLAGEHYLAYYHRAGQLNAHAFRFFNVFGPRQDPSSPYSGVISIFLERANRGAPITVFGDGRQTRDFVYVTDVVAALITALASEAPPKPELPVLNIGRGQETDLLTLLEAVGRLPDISGLDVSHGPARRGDILRSVASVKALEALGWSPQVSIQEGLEATLAWMRQE